MMVSAKLQLKYNIYPTFSRCHICMAFVAFKGRVESTHCFFAPTMFVFYSVLLCNISINQNLMLFRHKAAPTNITILKWWLSATGDQTEQPLAACIHILYIYATINASSENKEVIIDQRCQQHAMPNIINSQKENLKGSTFCTATVIKKHCCKKEIFVDGWEKFWICRYVVCKVF